MIVKMTILRLLGSSDDKEKIDVARPKSRPYGRGVPRLQDAVARAEPLLQRRRQGRRRTEAARRRGRCGWSCSPPWWSCAAPSSSAPA